MTIQRWNFNLDHSQEFCTCDMDKDRKGNYVLYLDHLAAATEREAKLVASLQNLVAAICKVQDWDGTRVGFALDDADATLALVKGGK